MDLEKDMGKYEKMGKYEEMGSMRKYEEMGMLNYIIKKPSHEARALFV